MITRAFIRAVGQLGDPAFRRVMGWTVLLTLLVFVMLAAATAEGLDHVPEFESRWLDVAVDMAAGLGFLFAAWFLFPGVATAIMGLFLDDAAEAVENRHYPDDTPGKALGMATAFWEALKLGLVILGVNVAALPLYIVALFIPLGPAVLYYAINSYLLGREYFELVALRHMEAGQAKALRQQYSGSITLAGMVVAVAFSIPFVNLLAPLLGTAYMVHIFKALESRRAGAIAGEKT